MTKVKLDFVLIRTCQATVRRVSLNNFFMTIRIRFKLIYIAKIWSYIYEGKVSKFNAENYSLEGIDRIPWLVQFHAR